MITYTYRCGCGDRDLEFPMGEAPERFGVCPACESDLRRVYNLANVIMGPGFRPRWADTPQKSSEAQARFGRRQRR